MWQGTRVAQHGNYARNGSNEAGWVYIGWQPGTQNGNSGSECPDHPHAAVLDPKERSATKAFDRFPEERMKRQWLSVPRGFCPIRFAVCVAYSVVLATMTASAADPVINTGGLLEAAGYSGRFTPGSILSLFGTNLATATSGASAVPLPTSLGGTSVLVNGQAAPLFFVSPTQINFQLPWETAGQTQVSIAVRAGTVTSSAQNIPLAASAPGLFATNSAGTGQGAIQIANTVVFAAPTGSIPGAQARPANRGEDLSIFCASLGSVANQPLSGAAAPTTPPLSTTIATPNVSMGGVQSDVTFSGLAPGFVGLYQVNVRVPDNAPSGDSVPITVNIGTVASNTVTVAVQGPAGVALSTLTLSSNSATAGTSVTGTVTLSGSDPKGGVIVTLRNNSTAAQLPAGGSVTVPAGQTSATFAILTQSVSSPQDVTITASYGGVSRTATLTVNPAAQPGSVRVNPQDGLNYVWIPVGTYTMGCSPGDSDCDSNESPSHSVTISNGFWMGQTEVTVGAYERFAQATGLTMPPAPSFNPQWAQESHPIVNLTWDDARRYCTWAAGRLPTEAEWEYSARAGTQTKYYFGNDTALLGDYAWYSSNSGSGTHPVGQKKPNAWSLYDILGNVWEWCQDWYGSYPSQAVTDPAGPSSGTSLILRGGSWADGAPYIRVSKRVYGVPGGRSGASGGFRCVFTGGVLEGLALSTGSITGGVSMTGTVTLAGPALAGRVIVSLQSNNSSAQVPASVTVAAGQTAATFSITTQAVSVAQNVTVTASYAGVSKTATLTVNPATPAITLNGTYSGDASDSSGPGTMIWRLTQTGSSVSGTMTGIGGSAVFNGNITGTLSGTTLTFTIVVPPGGISGLPSCSITITGSALNVTSTTIKGTYSGTGTCTPPFTNGQFTLSKQ
jgi:uncharacterized protein (TIGR03437 family)